MSLHDLERRLDDAQRRRREQSRRKVSVARFEQERTAALQDPSLSPVRRARLTANGGRGMSQRALAVCAGVSRDVVSRAETDPESVSLPSLRHLAAALGVSVAELQRP